MKPQIWVFAGPNGSGKSTVVDKYLKNRLPIINPDIIAAKLAPDKIHTTHIMREAGRIAMMQRAECLEKKLSFAMETTLAGHNEITTMMDAKNAGYKTNLVYVNIKNPMVNITRVAQRVLAGGHDVPVGDILRRYERSLRNLSKAIQLADRTYIIDNSSNKLMLCVAIEHSKIKYIAKKLPEWINLTELELMIKNRGGKPPHQ